MSPAGRLTTHVLDVARGRPAPGVPVAVFRLGAAGEELVGEAVTNADGRTDAPLIDALQRGTYELRFTVGEYLAAGSEPAGDPPFLDVVPVRFGISDPECHHHVPLLLAPWAYSTYRGS
jgi:hydroxyisourate hydrolase